MANALTSLQFDAESEGLLLHQTLHGYAEGHRLLESSTVIPEDLKRLMLRMSDLSGTSVVSGFQDYLTGYPLHSIQAYALGMTWYAPEMPRPGCVWTHTLLIPASTMARMSSLASLLQLFRRPDGRSLYDVYSRPLLLVSEAPKSDFEYESDLGQRAKLQALITAHYQEHARPLIISASSADEYRDLIFALWSQKWPALRMSFTFCTGSLSARTIEKRPLDVQCVPSTTIRQVSREVAEAGSGDPIMVNLAPLDLPHWTMLAASDALRFEGGAVRSFLWTVADTNSTRADFESFVKIYDGLDQPLPITEIIKLTAQLFPDPKDGRQLKSLVFGGPTKTSVLRAESKDILLALATTADYESFDPDTLSVREQASRLMAERPKVGCLLLGELFRASLNPIGDEILVALIVAMRPEDALEFAVDKQQFVPTLFRANPKLATSAQIWRVARDRRRELFESLVAQPSIDREALRGIMNALLDSNSDTFVERALDQWGSKAVNDTLDWIEAHGGSMTETCRAALAFHVPDVASWVDTGRDKSTDTLAAVVRIIAPQSNLVAQNDSTVWLCILRSLRENHREDDANYVCAFLLALALRNAPPDPLDLVSESFERVHKLAEKERLSDDAWFVLEPLVPELSWGRNWDKCERLRRGLVSSFVRHQWPAGELLRRIQDDEVLEQLLRSARRVDGGEIYFGEVGRMAQ